MKNKIAITSIFLALTFAVNAQNWWGGKNRIKGNGRVITTTRTISDFDDVSVGGSFEVLLVKGKEGKIVIEAEENIIPYIETEVNGDHLKIQYKKNTNISTSKRVTVTVYFEEINGVSMGGSGRISSDDIMKAKRFKVNIGGSGKINLHLAADKVFSSIGGSGDIILKGEANEVNCKVAGSGSVKGYELTTDELQATIAGSGSIKMTVKTKINAKVVGSGSIYYKGNPKYIDTKSVGSGNVIDRN